MGLLGILRIHQWYKNLLCLSIFLISPFSFNLTHLLLVLGFCLASSAVYVFNDLMDREGDAIREDRRHRPLVSGAISVFQAALLIPLLCTVTWLVWPDAISFRWVLLYWGMNVAYNLWIKKNCGYGLSTAICITGCYLARVMPLVSQDGFQTIESALLASIALIAFPLVVWKQRSYLHVIRRADEPLKLLGISGIGLLCAIASICHGVSAFVVWPLVVIAYLQILTTSSTREPYLALIPLSIGSESRERNGSIDALY